MSLGGSDVPIVVVPDAGPLITLAYADSLDLLHAAGGEVAIVDMVEHEVTRLRTPTSERIGTWIRTRADHVIDTAVFARYRKRLDEPGPHPRKANLGELGAQEAMNALAVESPPREAIFIFEDHKLARTGFVLPEGCSKVSTRAWLRFLERTGRIDSAAEIERRASAAGRAFSALRFPADP